MKYDCEKAKEVLAQRLSEARYEHSLNVADEAMVLAQIYGEDPEKAYYAGLIHDICKDDTKDDLLQRLKDSAIIWDEKALAQPALWHAMAASIFIQDELKVQDEDIINAVRYHTTGRRGMSRLERIIYLADVTSVDRQYGDVDKVRALAHGSMERAMLYVLQYTISELVAHKRPLVKDTCQAYNELVG